MKAAIILAAGASDRMGREKGGLAWLDGKTLLAWMVEALAGVGWQPFVVLGPHNVSNWSGKLPGATVCLNPEPLRGKITSVAAGLEKLPPQCERLLITAVDQPRPPELYRLLAEKAESAAIVVPDNAGRRGHPVVFEGRFRNAILASLAEDRLGLRGFLDEHRGETTRIPCPADWLRWDFNTPEAYEEALAWFREKAS